MIVTPKKWAFPGLHSFEDDPVDCQLFFGRKKEIKALAEKILIESITILFSRSGDGKTSLINAGLKQLLRELGYFPVRARIFNSPEAISPIEALYHAIENEARLNGISLPVDWSKSTLWETFYYLLSDQKSDFKPIVLILDQFEELFTIMAARKNEQENFIQQFADLVRGRLPQTLRDQLLSQLAMLDEKSNEALEIQKFLYSSTAPEVRVLLSLREDYLAFLDNLSDRIPRVYHCRYRLSSLSVNSAREAITEPPKQKSVFGEYTFEIEPEAVKAMLNFLTEESGNAGFSEKVVGPPLLQVLCRQLEERMRQMGKNCIGLDDLGSEKDMRHLLLNYYHSILKKFPLFRFGWGPRKRRGLLDFVGLFLPVHFPRWTIRQLCEIRLTTTGGNRNNQHEDEIVGEIGVPRKDLDTLVNSCLLRRESRLKQAFYELSHDSLVPSLWKVGKHRQNLMRIFNSLGFGLLIFFIFQWGRTYVRGWFDVDLINKDFIAVKKKEIAVDDFKRQLARIKKRAPDLTEIVEVEKNFDNWRIGILKDEFLNSNDPYLDRADSILNVLKREYSYTPQLSALDDTLRQRKLREAERRYFQMVRLEGKVPSEATLDDAAVLLDQAFTRFVRDHRTLELQDEQVTAKIQIINSQGMEVSKSFVFKIDRVPPDLNQNQVIVYYRNSSNENWALMPSKEWLGILWRIEGRASESLQFCVAHLVLADSSEQKYVGIFSAKKDVFTIEGSSEDFGSPARLSWKIEMQDLVGRKNTIPLGEWWRYLHLRNKPKLLSEVEVDSIFKKYDFFDSYLAQEPHRYEAMKIKEYKTVFDRTAGLMWQQSGSNDSLKFNQAEAYVRELNAQKYADFDDWRLPTLEEALSLRKLERSSKKNVKLYLDPVFDYTQRGIWTSDRESAERVWTVGLEFRSLLPFSVDDYAYVRAVR